MATERQMHVVGDQVQDHRASRSGTRTHRHREVVLRPHVAVLIGQMSSLLYDGLTRSSPGTRQLESEFPSQINAEHADDRVLSMFDRNSSSPRMRRRRTQREHTAPLEPAAQSSPPLLPECNASTGAVAGSAHDPHRSRTPPHSSRPRSRSPSTTATPPQAQDQPTAHLAAASAPASDPKIAQPSTPPSSLP